MKSDVVYFISDAHLGMNIPGCHRREEHLISFLDKTVSAAATLFIVGDLFDFWIEYHSAIRPDYFPVLHALKKLSDAGVEVHYLAGNHDFALGNFLKDVIGVSIHNDAFVTTIQGKRLHIFHGDGLAKNDVGYRILKKILRNPLNQRLYKLLHPDIGVWLGSLSSGSSRKLSQKLRTEAFLEEYRRIALRHLEKDFDIVVFGHTHTPELLVADGKAYCNVGEWINDYTFAKLENGAMTLWNYRADSAPQEIAAKPLNSGSSAS